MEDRVRGMDYYMLREYLGKNTPGIEAGNSGVAQKGQYFNQNMGFFSPDTGDKARTGSWCHILIDWTLYVDVYYE